MHSKPWQVPQIFLSLLFHLGMCYFRLGLVYGIVRASLVIQTQECYNPVFCMLQLLLGVSLLVGYGESANSFKMEKCRVKDIMCPVK